MSALDFETVLIYANTCVLLSSAGSPSFESPPTTRAALSEAHKFTGRTRRLTARSIGPTCCATPKLDRCERERERRISCVCLPSVGYNKGAKANKRRIDEKEKEQKKKKKEQKDKRKSGGN